MTDKYRSGRSAMTWQDRSMVALLAARIARSDSAWSTGELVAAGGTTRTITPALPADVGPGAVEVALLCFDARPQALPRSIAMLADADPDVVFVPAEPVTVPAR